jgi:hypothetical protein
VACEEEIAPEAPVLRKEVETPVSMGATGTNVSTHTDGGQEHSTGAPRNLASACPRRPPLVTYHLLLGSLISWTWETGSWGY